MLDREVEQLEARLESHIQPSRRRHQEPEEKPTEQNPEHVPELGGWKPPNM
ncbi:hypothetical protein [Halomonas sp. QHL1]|uniref:hypothetical protein n=1 Tax=Halomonas sp. QHL1 TaxID=1123773 RepID=UPI001587A1BF|nr:hypothetical protein [Halomonas sp. QHL1]